MPVKKSFTFLTITLIIIRSPAKKPLVANCPPPFHPSLTTSKRARQTRGHGIRRADGGGLALSAHAKDSHTEGLSGGGVKFPLLPTPPPPPIPQQHFCPPPLPSVLVRLRSCQSEVGTRRKSNTRLTSTAPISPFPPATRQKKSSSPPAQSPFPTPVHEG